MNLLCIFLAGLLTIVASWNHIDLKYSRVMKAHGNQKTAVITWGYDRGNSEITIELTVPKASWIGLGLSSDGSLNGSDIVIGGWNEEKKQIFYDAHVEGQWPPVKDSSQDYELVDLSHNGTHSFLKVWRKFFTCDSNDHNIENDTVRVRVVFGEDIDLQYSEECVFIASIFFLEITDKFNLSSKVLSYDLKLTDFHIPVEDTTYACTFFPLPVVTSKHHIIKYEPHLTPSSIPFIHHILIYSCPENTNVTSEVAECYSSDPRFYQCLQVMIGWGVGGEDFYFPEIAGMPIGTENDPKYVRMEIHYSNFDGVEGLIDNSGIRIFYTPELRPHDFGVLMLGVFTFPIHIIPPGSKSFRTYGLCNTDLFSKVLDDPVEDLFTHAFLLHAHLTARGLRMMHYRDGKLIGSLGEDKTYDFNFQQTRIFPRGITIKPGDQILVECTADTMDREFITYGGQSTKHEMCVGFLFYYPSKPIAACWSLLDMFHVTDALGMERADSLLEAALNLDSVEWDDKTRNVVQNAMAEADHIVYVENRKGVRVNETSPVPPIFPPVPHSCDKDSSP